MSTDKNKSMASQCWKVGSEAMLKQNWPYAIEMFSKCVKFVPDNVVYRQTLRGVVRRSYKDNKTGASMSGMKLMGPRGRIKKARMTKDWASMDLAAEEGLAVNPWDASLHADLGEATYNLGHKDVAVYAYQMAVENDGSNKVYCRALAELLEERGEYTQASALWDRICRIDPMDGDARSRANQAATKHVIDRGGYEGADDTKGVMADHEVQKRLKQPKPGEYDGPGQSDEADLQRMIRKEPENKDYYTKLAELYRREGKHDQAMPLLQKALEISGGDINLREMLEDSELDMVRKNVSIAKERLQGSEDEALKKRYDELKRELRLREMEIYRTRVERHPSNMNLKYNLAECFMAEKKYSEAIPLFQQSSQDSRLECKALYNMGLCFIQEKKYPLARRQLEKAIPKLNAHDHHDQFLDTHYWLARLCEQAKDNEAAETHYSEVLAVDYGYKDALKRLEGLQGGGE